MPYLLIVRKSLKSKHLKIPSVCLMNSIAQTVVPFNVCIIKDFTGKLRILDQKHFLCNCCRSTVYVLEMFYWPMLLFRYDFLFCTRSPININNYKNDYVSHIIFYNFFQILIYKSFHQNSFLVLQWSSPKSGAIIKIVGFINGTVCLCRSQENQRIIYNAYKTIHAIKFQSIVAQNGLIAMLELLLLATWRGGEELVYVITRHNKSWL